MNLVTFCVFEKNGFEVLTGLGVWGYARGGAGLGIGNGGRECQRRASDGFQEGGVPRGCPGHPG